MGISHRNAFSLEIVFMINIYSICVLILTLFSCSKHKIEGELYSSFQIPKVVNTSIPDSITKVKFHEEHLSYTHMPFVGKFIFQDEIDINSRTWYHQILDDLKVDDYSWIKNDSLDANGLEIVPDYSQTVYYNVRDSMSLAYYPVFLVNLTSPFKVWTGKDFRVRGIQEAYHQEYHRWLPIEYSGNEYEMCGNGYMYLVINPHEFVVILLPKYSGSFNTSLRVRIENGSTTYVSKPFFGNIDGGQFGIDTSTFHNHYLENADTKELLEIFLGADFSKTYSKSVFIAED